MKINIQSPPASSVQSSDNNLSPPPPPGPKYTVKSQQDVPKFLSKSLSIFGVESKSKQEENELVSFLINQPLPSLTIGRYCKTSNKSIGLGARSSYPKPKVSISPECFPPLPLFDCSYDDRKNKSEEADMENDKELSKSYSTCEQ
jgi:hypothetical protein